LLDVGLNWLDDPDQDNQGVRRDMSTTLHRSGKFSPSPETADIAQAVRQARLRHRLTQTELAGLAGTGLRFISELERGKPNVALNKLLAVLAVLGLRMQIVEAQQ
jgi:y4mF family transcriptional regulator